MEKLRLNLGCGSVRPAGWINTDSSLNAHLQRLPLIGKLVPKLLGRVKYDSSNVKYMNLNKRWGFADNSVDLVYASHLFEHLTIKSANLFLKESYRCLKPGGVIRLVVPDLYKISRKYVTEFENGVEKPSEYFMWAVNMHREGQYGQKLSAPRKMILEWQGYPHQHKFMYDEKSLSALMLSHGFTNLLVQEYGQSVYVPEIADVEGTRESYLSVYIEGKKPVEKS